MATLLGLASVPLEDGSLWALFDSHVGAQQQVTSTTASATVEVQSNSIDRTASQLRLLVIATPLQNFN